MSDVRLPGADKKVEEEFTYMEQHTSEERHICLFLFLWCRLRDIPHKSNIAAWSERMEIVHNFVCICAFFHLVYNVSTQSALLFLSLSFISINRLAILYQSGFVFECSFAAIIISLKLRLQLCYYKIFFSYIYNDWTSARPTCERVK